MESRGSVLNRKLDVYKRQVLGSTGSIGTQTLEIVRTNQDIEVTALAAGSNITLLEKQIREFRPRLAAVWEEDRAAELKSRVRDIDVQVRSGMDGLLAVASEPEAEILVTAIVGMIGILPVSYTHLTTSAICFTWVSSVSYFSGFSD